jgi:predicted AlkP superfamily phosphohydrolase/phosphomutase
MSVVVLGLDGLTWTVLEPLMARGHLPTFAALCRHGTWGRLESTIPAVTPTAWPSMLTGKNPAHHGVFGFRRPRPEGGFGEFAPVTGFDYDANPLWRILQRFGRRSAFFNVPCAYPLDPEFAAGVLTSGYMTPSTGHVFAYPPAFGRRLLDRHPAFAFKLARKSTPPHLVVSRAIEIARAKFDAIRDLRCQEDWSVLFAVIDEPDALQHYMWNAIVAGQPQAVAFYAMLDREIGELLADVARRGDHLLIVSDHGFRGVTSFFCANEALASLGYLRFPTRRGRAWSRSTAVDLVRRAPLAMPLVERYRSRVRGPREEGQPMSLGSTFAEASAVAVDSGSGICAGIYGMREAPDILDRLERDLGRLLSRFPAVRLRRGRDLYRGPHAAELPPLVLASDGAMSVHPGRHGRLTRRINTSGVHDRWGVIVATGPGVRAAAGIEAHLYDVLPTVLTLLDLPVPDDVDGRPIGPVVAGARPPRAYDPRTGAVYTGSASAGTTLVQERLRRLRQQPR